MIKKFYEYANDIKKELKDILPMEEVEDQFLRLEEVFGLEIITNLNFNHIIITVPKNFKNLKYASEELNRIKNYLETKYPIKIRNEFGGNSLKLYEDSDIWIYISIKKQNKQ